MPPGSSRQPGASIPVFPLYGESTPWARPELLHLETIAERSSVHDWVIQPHRHSDLAQLLWLARGHASIHLDGQRHEVEGPVLQYIPRLCVHGFVFSQDVQGQVLTLAAPLLGRISDELCAGHALQDAFRMTPPPADGTLAALFDTLQAEYRSTAPGREAVMHALCLQVLVQVLRDQASRARQGPGERSLRERQLEQFRDLVEREFRRHLPVAHYAGQLGTSVASLNRLCRELAGASAQELMHRRVLLEATRALAYTGMRVQQIADALGFSDPAYFSRFFTRHMGCSPSVFRARRAAGDAGDTPPG